MVVAIFFFSACTLVGMLLCALKVNSVHRKYLKEGSRICQCSQLHQFSTFDNNIASQVKIRQENGLYNLFNCFELPGNLENGSGRTFSWAPLGSTALNISGPFLLLI